MKRLNRRTLLKSGAALFACSALPWWEVATAQAQNRTKNLIVVLAPGGWDISACLDPKPQSELVATPPGELKTFGDLELLTGPERPAVEQFFSTWSANAAVLHGIEVRSIAHEECSKRILTGTNSASNPDIGSIIGRQAEGQVPVPYMVLGNTAFTGPYTGSSGRVGLTGQLSTLLTPERAYPFENNTTRFNPDAAESDLIRDFVRRRADHVMQTRGQAGVNREKLNDFKLAVDNSQALRSLSDSFGEQQFALEFEPQINLAIRVLKDGISRSVIIQDPNDWDTHDDNDNRQFANLQMLYTNLQTLMGRLESEALLDDTIVVVMSEMSRTPQKNQGNGKDHWPVTSSLILGASVNGGRSYGATSDSVESLPVSPETGELDDAGVRLNGKHFAATVLELTGADSTEHFPDARPILALKKG